MVVKYRHHKSGFLNSDHGLVFSHLGVCLLLWLFSLVHFGQAQRLSVEVIPCRNNSLLCFKVISELGLTRPLQPHLISAARKSRALPCCAGKKTDGLAGLPELKCAEALRLMLGGGPRGEEGMGESFFSCCGPGAVAELISDHRAGFTDLILFPSLGRSEQEASLRWQLCCCHIRLFQ